MHMISVHCLIYYCKYQMVRSKKVSALCICAVFIPLPSTRWPATARWPAAENGNSLPKTIALQNCYKRASYGKFQQEKRPLFRISPILALIPSKNRPQIQKIDQLVAFCVNQMQFFINFIPSTHSKIICPSQMRLDVSDLFRFIFHMLSRQGWHGA